MRCIQICAVRRSSIRFAVVNVVIVVDVCGHGQFQMDGICIMYLNGKPAHCKCIPCGSHVFELACEKKKK